jgi:hypothetical protein
MRTVTITRNGEREREKYAHKEKIGDEKITHK